MIEHNINGPFVRAAWNATAVPQTEIAYAVRVKFADGHEEVWSAQDTPTEPHRLNRWIQTWSTKEKPIIDVTPVQREVTISATDWVAVESE